MRLTQTRWELPELRSSGHARPELVPVAAATAVAVVVGAAAILVHKGLLADAMGAGAAVIMTCALAALGAATARRAANRSAGIERRVWRLLSLGLLSWALGVIPYLAFLVSGGDIRSPAAYSQIGFLLAYPFWYRALWLVREPVVGPSRLHRAEMWLTESAVFLLIAATAAGLLWREELGVAANIAQLTPLALDLLLLHAVYSAVRRSSVTHRAAFVWLAYGFALLAVTDGLVTLLVASAPIPIMGIAMLGYAGAMCLLAIAATRPLRITEAQVMLGRSAALLAALGVALAGVAAAVDPSSLRPFFWAVGFLLFVRLWVLLGRHGQSETDPLTGFLESRAFTRHLSGVAQVADAERPAGLIAVELDRFESWSSHMSAGERDAALAEVAERLDASPLERGIWGRLGADRMAWVGRIRDAAQARVLAESARSAAAANGPELSARAGFVMIPTDAAEAGDVIAAAMEALGAARSARRRVVAFDRGQLDGIEHSGSYSASLDQRRQMVLEIFRTRDAVESRLQPIVALDDGAIVGFEALTRIRIQPMRTPDFWIAEAHAVGLGAELEVACVRTALRRRAEIGDDMILSLNVGPDAILMPEMAEAFGAGSLENIIIEITEHDEVRDYTRLAVRLADYRGRGAKVAIDDTGAGHSSMRHIAQLAPDFIKIDRSLITDLHLDHAKRALVRSMVSLEQDLGTRLIAEGIEQPGELRALRELGVPLGQGFLLGRPLPHVQGGPAVAAWGRLVGDRPA
jgi:EAL domain-containing protein (putative c-di-GMP-specific phosphodiesterase class I)/GGDEF domain-containing protein